MATKLSLSGPVGYMGGSEQTSGPFVGRASSKNYVLRYRFKTPADGYVTTIKFTNKFTKLADATYSISSTRPVRVKVSPSSSEYKNAGSGSSYDATFTGSGTVTISGLKLTPNTTYYIWLFPGFSDGYSLSYCYHASSDGSTTVSDASATYEASPLGQVYIGNGEAFEAYEVYIGNGAEWERYIPYVGNGTGWDQCS